MYFRGYDLAESVRKHIEHLKEPYDAKSEELKLSLIDFKTVITRDIVSIEPEIEFPILIQGCPRVKSK